MQSSPCRSGVVFVQKIVLNRLAVRTVLRGLPSQGRFAPITFHALSIHHVGKTMITLRGEGWEVINKATSGLMSDDVGIRTFGKCWAHQIRVFLRFVRRSRTDLEIHQVFYPQATAATNKDDVPIRRGFVQVGIKTCTTSVSKQDVIL